jgi:hypothetical protein
MLYHKNTLPKDSKISNPKMEIEGMSWAAYWEDEGLPNPSFQLTRAILYVIHFRTQLIVGNQGSIANYGPKGFNQLMYKLARFYFPDWIGFRKERCSYNPELADRILRHQKVAEWKTNKIFDSEI